MFKRMDKIGTLDEYLSNPGETISLFIRFWLTVTPPLPEIAQSSARAKDAERFDDFM